MRALAVAREEQTAALTQFLSPQDENRGYFCVLRLAAFLLLIVGIVERNRRR